jgi:hypothetical protein
MLKACKTNTCTRCNQHAAKTRTAQELLLATPIKATELLVKSANLALQEEATLDHTSTMVATTTAATARAATEFILHPELLGITMALVDIEWDKLPKSFTLALWPTFGCLVVWLGRGHGRQIQVFKIDGFV